MLNSKNFCYNKHIINKDKKNKMPEESKKKVIDIFPPKKIAEKEQEQKNETLTPEPEEKKSFFYKEEELNIKVNYLEPKETTFEKPEQEEKTEVSEGTISPEEKNTPENQKEDFLTKEFSFLQDLQKDDSKKRTFLKSSSFKKFFLSKNQKIGIFFGVIGAAAIFYYFGFFVLARAEIKITSRKLEVPFSRTVLIDRNVSSPNFDNDVIPGNLFVFKENVEKEFSSTGQGKDEKKAQGTITIYNNFSSAPQILVATTRFETPDNKIYRLDSRIVVPGAATKDGKIVPSSIDAKVTADKAGPEYNIEPCNLPKCKFTIPGFKGTEKYEGFYGVSTSPMAGGALGSIPMITADDMKVAEKEILENGLLPAINQSLLNKIPAGLKILPEAKSGVKINKLVSDANIGDMREKFNVSAEGEVKAIAFDQNNLLEYIKKTIEKEKEQNQDYADYEPCQTAEIEYSDAKVDFNLGTIKVLVKTKQIFCEKINEETLKNSIKGKNRNQLQEIFRNTKGVEEVKINLWPWWIKKIPSALDKIKISVD